MGFKTYLSEASSSEKYEIGRYVNDTLKEVITGNIKQIYNRYSKIIDDYIEFYDYESGIPKDIDEFLMLLNKAAKMAEKKTKTTFKIYK